MDRKRTVIIILLIILCVIGFFIVQNVSKAHMRAAVEREVIYDGVYISDIHIGGLKQQEAIKLVKAHVQKEQKDAQLKILAEGKELHLLPYSYFVKEIDYKSLVKKAYEIGRTGSLKERYKLIKKVKKEKNVIPIILEYKEEQMVALLEFLRPKFEVAPKDAFIERVNQAFVIHDEVIGKTIQVEKSVEAIIQAINAKNNQIELVVTQSKPKITKEAFTDVKDLIGSFYTQFSSNQPARNENLRIASSKINGTILFPGEIFSTNNTIGPVDSTNGYQEAPIILNGKIIPGIGGGVCQIATTLYNAVLFAELEIVQRQNHSMLVGYIDKARDATLAGDYIDFKFKNNTDTPIYIESFIENNRLYMQLYGKEIRETARTIDFESVITGTIMPPPQKVTFDNTMAEGKEVVEKKSTIGYTVKLYKLIYLQGKLSEKIEINTSTYGATPAEVRRGTLVKAVEIPQTEEKEDTITNPEAESILPPLTEPVSEPAIQIETEPTTEQFEEDEGIVEEE